MEIKQSFLNSSRLSRLSRLGRLGRLGRLANTKRQDLFVDQALGTPMQFAVL